MVKCYISTMCTTYNFLPYKILNHHFGCKMVRFPKCRIFPLVMLQPKPIYKISSLQHIGKYPIGFGPRKFKYTILDPRCRFLKGFIAYRHVPLKINIYAKFPVSSKSPLRFHFLLIYAAILQ